MPNKLEIPTNVDEITEKELEIGNEVADDLVYNDFSNKLTDIIQKN